MIGGSKRAARGWLVGLVAAWPSPGAAQPQAYAAQQQNALAQGRANYERAFGACMSWRGYSVL